MKAGDNILWKKGGVIANTLSFIIGIFYSDWRKRKWKPWHAGFIVKILSDEIVTCEAIKKGISYVTYASAEDMGDCRIYSWLSNPDSRKIEDWAADHVGLHYDVRVYFWTVLGAIRMKLFGKPFRIVNKEKMCWETMSEFDRYMGKELQPEEEPCLINLMINRLEK